MLVTNTQRYFEAVEPKVSWSTDVYDTAEEKLFAVCDGYEEEREKERERERREREGDP